MLRSISCRKFVSSMLFTLVIGLPGLVHAQSQPVQHKPGQTKPAQSKPQSKPPQNSQPVPNARPKNNIDLCFLSLEINALQALRQFQFDNDQLAKLMKIAFGPLGKSGTTSQNRMRGPGNVSKDVREKMLAIRKAILDSRDEADIAKMTEELAATLEKEKVSIDVEVDISDGARKEAVNVYRMLRVDQLAGYIAQVTDNIEEPIDQFMSSLEEIGTLSDDEWKEQQSEIANEIAQTAAGLDSVKVKKLSEELLPLLAKARGLNKAALEKKMPELQQAARAILGDISAETILRNRVQIDLATLLSNSQVINACREIKKANEANSASAK